MHKLKLNVEVIIMSWMRVVVFFNAIPLTNAWKNTMRLLLTAAMPE